MPTSAWELSSLASPLMYSITISMPSSTVSCHPSRVWTPMVTRLLESGLVKV